MLDGLDSIPWKRLGHAYGPADDVPGLLRALQTASPEFRSEDSLSKLYGNIWHQGTVYEATAYAVPFLIELATDPATPDRVGILTLLAEIARGSSYLAVHRKALDSPNVEDEKKRELGWVAAAHNAVADGFEALTLIARDGGDVQLAAGYVLAQLPEHAESVSAWLRALLAAETVALRRVGYLLLLGHTVDRSSMTLMVLLAALGANDNSQHRAAVLSIARFRPQPLPSIAREAIMQALLEDDLEESFVGLPWDTSGDIDLEMLLECLDGEARSEVAERLIVAIESGGGTHEKFVTLLDVLFPRAEDRPPAPLTARDLSPLQARAVQAMASAMEGRDRIFIGHFPDWGLPDTMRGWRDLAAGREAVPVDMTLPVFADPRNPGQPLRPDRLKPGQRILHKKYGLGTVQQCTLGGGDATLKVEFDDEGLHTLMFRSGK